MSIPALNKKEREDCVHLLPIVTPVGGCSIYDERPEACRKFECFWKQGVIGGESHRPDRLGIMFTAWEHNGEHIVHAWELKEDQSEDEKVRRIFDEISQVKTFVIVRYHGLMKLCGKTDRVEQFIEKHTGLTKICDYNLGPGPMEGELVVVYQNMKDKKMTIKMPERSIPLTAEEQDYVIKLSLDILDRICTGKNNV